MTTHDTRAGDGEMSDPPAVVVETDTLEPQRTAVVDALKAWSDASGFAWEGPLAAFWRVYCGLPFKSATYAAYHGTKEVWTVVLEHSDHAERAAGRRQRRGGSR